MGNQVNTASFASLGDTITALGPTGGLNLGVTLNVNGSASTYQPLEDDTWLVVAAYAPGVFDSNAYNTPLWSEAFGLGTDSLGAAPGQSTPGSGIVGYYNISALTNSYADGSESIPISIPFDTLPSTFDLFRGDGFL